MDTQQAFAHVYEAHADALFRHCVFRVSNRERAIELVQDAFMKAWDKVARGEEIRNERAFLFRILNNLIIDEYRKKKSTSLDALLDADDGVQEGSFDELRSGDRDSAEDEANIRFQSDDLQAALGALPDQYRSVVVMRYIDELRPKEIADVLGETENAVSVRINRGMKKLRQTLAAHEEHTI